MRRFGLYGLFVLGLMSASAVASDGWRKMDGQGISAALSGKTLDYNSAWQDFRISGKTLYNAGEDSWGNWRIQADQYCSQWPPRDLWDCYDVERLDDKIKFIGRAGDVTIGTIRK